MLHVVHSVGIIFYIEFFLRYVVSGQMKMRLKFVFQLQVVQTNERKMELDTFLKKCALVNPLKYK